MSPEQELLEKWRSLDKQKQEEVLDFVNFIYAKMLKPQPLTRANKSQLGKRLRQIRAEIVFSGEHLLTQDELEKAIGNRGYTNEVHLRGLSETHAGGFSLYSPRLLVCSRSVRLSAWAIRQKWMLPQETDT